MKLYVGNVPFDTRDEDLQQLFATYGTVKTASVVMDRQSGRSRGFAFVEFDDPGEAKAAVAGLNGKEFGGRTLVVNEARTDGGGGRGGGGGFGGGRGGAGGGGGFGGGRGGDRGGERRGPSGGRSRF